MAITAVQPLVSAAPSLLPLEAGRASYANEDWDDAFKALSLADAASPLAAHDLERLAWSAGLTARDDDMLPVLERAHRAYLDAGEALAAARTALWLGFRLFARREAGRAGGWLARAQRLVDEERRAGRDCVEQGYLLLPATQRHLNLCELDAACESAAAAAALGERFGDRDLVAFARNLQGRALLRLRRIDEGLVLLDEVLVGVSTGELAPVMTGLIYCSAIAACQRIHAYDRMREWTVALAAWCEARAQLVMFKGHCLVHRAQLMQMTGAWDEALAEARAAVQRCVGDFDGEALGLAHYEQGEIHRLRGDASEAEAAYREASRAGVEPQPGLALLRLAQGDRDGAAGAMRRMLASTRDGLVRARLLPAVVEVLVSGPRGGSSFQANPDPLEAAGDLEQAREACDELERTAAGFATQPLAALAAQTRAALQLSEGQAEAVPEPLRGAFAVWQRLGAQHQAARARLLMGRACAALGDAEGARLEWEAAREVFASLGARPSLVEVDALLGRMAANGEPSGSGNGNRIGAGNQRAAHGLSAREVQVLRLVATGLTNKLIARELHLSDKTIDRHLSNIFAKLVVGSRAAATAYAYRHGLAAAAAVGGIAHAAAAPRMGDSAEANAPSDP